MRVEWGGPIVADFLQEFSYGSLSVFNQLWQETHKTKVTLVGGYNPVTFMDMFPFILWTILQGLIRESSAARWCQIEFPEYLAPIWWDPAQHLHFHMEISVLALSEESVSGKLFGVDLEYERNTL